MSESTGSDNMDQNKDCIYDCMGWVTWTEFYQRVIGDRMNSLLFVTTGNIVVMI